jgi:hypothetical protein
MSCYRQTGSPYLKHKDILLETFEVLSNNSIAKEVYFFMGCYTLNGLIGTRVGGTCSPYFQGKQGSRFSQNVGTLAECTVSHPRRQQSS